MPFAEGKRWDENGSNGQPIEREGTFRQLFDPPDEWPGPEDRRADYG